MKTKRTATTKTTAREQIRDFAAVPRKETAAGLPLPGFYCRSEDPSYRRVFWRRAAAVQAAYDSAPAGTEAITAVVWRRLQSFRPKLTARELDDLMSSQFRRGVMGALYGKISEIRTQEHRAAEAADDARRLQRTTRSKRVRKGGAK